MKKIKKRLYKKMCDYEKNIDKTIYETPEFQSIFSIIISIIIGLYESNLFYAVSIYTLIYMMFKLIEIKYLLTIGE